MRDLCGFCREVYYGATPRALRARYILLVLDLVIISYFVVTTFLPSSYEWLIVTDMLFGSALVLDFAGRLIADTDRGAFLLKPMAVIDVVVIVSLLAPVFLGNLAFLRVARVLRLLRSYVVVRQLRSHSKFFAKNEDVVFSAMNLAVFVFVVAAVVFVLQASVNSSINNYFDALYFTIATLTTTGFGDIILVGEAGRLLAVVIMIVGVALFLRLAQTIFRPNKVDYECPGCGLTRHDRDAEHCKHCGRQLHIRTEGVTD